MKVELQAGDSITIPEGCKAVIKDGSVVFEKEQKFKDGDILAIADYVDTTCPFIYKNTDGRRLHSYYVGVDIHNQLSICDDAYFRWGNGVLRYATEEEKHQLFDKMEEQGLKWNAEEKKVEKIRWRAKYGEEYWYVTSSCAVAGDFMREENSLTGSGAIEDWSGYNHFQKKAQAKEAAKRVKETLKKYCEEIGE